jgi:hypothetical protein
VEGRQMIDYDEIKRMAKALDRPISTLIALAPQIDPFFDMPARKEAGEWVAKIYQQFGFGTGVHLRRIHYRLARDAGFGLERAAIREHP